MASKPIIYLLRPEFGAGTGPLRVHCSEVATFNQNLVSLIQDLIDTIQEHGIAVGLSAPQIGVRLRVCVILSQPKNHAAETTVLVNPRILAFSGDTKESYESCMSLPFYRGKVARPDKILVAYQDANGALIEKEFRGFFSRVIQHEIDHLDGVLYVDRMTSMGGLEPTDIFDADKYYQGIKPS